MPRLLRLLAPFVLLPGAVFAPAAAAADRFDGSVRSEASAERACQVAISDGAGVAKQTVRADANGLVRARLTAEGGDWDLGVFDAATGRSVAGSTYFGADELAEGLIRDGQELVVQACRISGDTPIAQLDVDTVGLPAPTGQKLRMANVKLPNEVAEQALETLDLDLTEHARPGHRDVVLHDAADEAGLKRAGLDYEITVPDLVAADRADARAGRQLRAPGQTGVPSGRTAYRRLPDYGTDMKRLVDENPTLVKPITLKNRTVVGRPVEGIEITKDVGAADGKPIFVQTGVHHAREWPSAEHAMEFAFELVNGVKAPDTERGRRISALLERSRVIVIPIINPDGFNLSREAPADLGQPVIDPGFAYKRRNCRITDGSLSPEAECGLQDNRNKGVDPNRNYGGLWGGAGASNSPTNDTYRGAGPFSEPESQNVRDLVSTRQVTTLITNHTYSDLVLRPPGVAAQGDPPDEPVYKALGDAMAAENGYTSQKSFELYDTTGTTEDWSYYATGGLGFTFEIGPAADGPTGLESLAGSGFHPPYPLGVGQEYNGKYPTGGGNREAYLLALESTANTERHSVLSGRAPAGATIRVQKSFDTTTSPVVQPNGPAADPIKFRDTLETSMTVPASGAFEYHVNPSTRPAAVGKPGRNPDGPTTAKRTFGSTGGTTSAPSQDPAASTSLNRKDFPFTVGADDDNVSINARIEWENVRDDWDLYLYRAGGATPLASSAQGGTDSEELTYSLGENEKLPAGEYFVRVIDFETTDKRFDGEITFGGPVPTRPTTTESWTLTCEQNGQVLGTQQVVVARGERKDTGEPCGTAARQVTPGPTTPGGGSGGGPGGGDTPTTACAATSGFLSVGATGSGKGATLGFTRRTSNPVTIDVFRQSVGRRVIGERLVARYTGRSKGVTWDGRGNRGKRRALGDGYYFVRYSMKTSAGTDTRRVVLQRAKGRFTKRADFFRRGSCDLLPSYKLERPVFGGSGRSAPLGVSYRLARAGRVTVTVTKGAKVVKKFPVRAVTAGRTIRLRLSGKGLSGGEYRVRLSARETSGATVTSTLVSRKL